MARRAPAFVRNQVKARHINIAHGLYPREPLSDTALTAVLAYLRRHMSTTGGRTYAGGLVKFEPKELERILLPRVEDIHGYLAEGKRLSRRRTEAELKSDAAVAKSTFRHERLLEPLDLDLRLLSAFRPALMNRGLLDQDLRVRAGNIRERGRPFRA
jgi:hypothetical protein